MLVTSCIYQSQRKLSQLKQENGKLGLHVTKCDLPRVPQALLCIGFSKLSFINVLKQGKAEEVLAKKKDLEATVENLQERGKEMKNILQVREV